MLVVHEGAYPVTHLGTGHGDLLHFRWVEARHFNVLVELIKTVLRNFAFAFRSQLLKRGSELVKVS